jgi:hypothetical protein
MSLLGQSDAVADHALCAELACFWACPISNLKYCFSSFISSFHVVVTHIQGVLSSIPSFAYFPCQATSCVILKPASYDMQVCLEIQALKYNHGMLRVITQHKALKYQHGDRQLIMRADALKMYARQLVHQAADPSEGERLLHLGRARLWGSAPSNHCTCTLGSHAGGIRQYTSIVAG